MKNKNKLSIKMIVFCIAFATTLSLLIGGLSYYTYSKSVEERYYTYVETMVKICGDNINGDDMKECIQTVSESVKYKESQELLNSIKENAQLQYIYMVYFDEQDRLVYAMNAYTQKELKMEANTISHLGDVSGALDFDETIKERFKESTKSGNKDEIILITNTTEADESNGGQMEYVLTGYKLISDSQGNHIGIIAVDISMTDIYNNLREYLMTLIVGALIVVVIFIVIVVAIVNKGIVKPIRKIADLANDFVLQSHEISNPNEFVVPQVHVKTKDEIEALANSLNHMTSEIVTYMQDLSSMAAKEERIAAEFGIVNQIKANLLPSIFPAFPERMDFSIYAKIKFAKEAKGNFYDYFLVDKSHLCITIGNVSGTGIPTTIFSVIACTHIKNYAKLGYGVARILAETNNQLSQNNEVGLSVNVFLGIIDLKKGELSYGNAGKSNPLIKKAGTDFEELECKKCFALATMENVQYSQQQINLMQGDMLFLYTLGLANIVDNKGNVFSAENIFEALNTIVTKEYELQNIVEQINTSVDTFRRGVEQEDDSSMILFRYM